VDDKRVIAIILLLLGVGASDSALNIMKPTQDVTEKINDINVLQQLVLYRLAVVEDSIVKCNEKHENKDD